MRRTALGLHLFSIIALGFFLLGCDAKSIERELGKLATAPGATQDSSRAAGLQNPSPIAPRQSAPSGSAETIRIATFNIQVFGTSKEKKSQVMDTLAEIVRRFDLVAIQEIRATDQGLIPRFVKRINVGGAHYGHVVGPRLGRTSSKEQYVYIFDTKRIAVDRRSIYTAADPEDYLHREPLVTRFRVLGPTDRPAFTFNLINIHTDPDETGTELNALDDVFVAVQSNASREDDVIMLGDLNVDDRHLGELGRLPGMAWVVAGQKTNTRQTKSYDNILFNRHATGEFTGNWGILNLMTEFGLSKSQALKISDHMPVWAEFSVFEAPSPVVAARPGTSGR